MEYTNDYIFNVHYKEVKSRNKASKISWTNSLYHKLKKHKIITMIIASGFLFCILDVMLVMNFFSILGRM